MEFRIERDLAFVARAQVLQKLHNVLSPMLNAMASSRFGVARQALSSQGVDHGQWVFWKEYSRILSSWIDSEESFLRLEFAHPKKFKFDVCFFEACSDFLS